MADPKFAMIRQFIYGWDWTEFGDDEQIIVYNSKEEALEALKEYIEDVNDAYDKGDTDPYENDCAIAEVTFSVKTIQKI